MEIVSDGYGRSYSFDTTALSNRMLASYDGSGVTVSYEYDARGNVTKVTHQPKPGSTLTPPYPNETADYDLVCQYPTKCNKPNRVKDANDKYTDFTYDNVHGGVLTKTLPADANGIRPQTRYSYVQRYAYYKSASGAMTKAATPIWVLDTESYCKTRGPNVTNTGCDALNADGFSDEVVTRYDYGPDTGPNNLLLMGITVTASGVTRRTCYTYDARGNKISETTPNAGLTSCPAPAY